MKTKMYNLHSNDWEININELEFGELLGTGSFGQVHRGTWKGTEVAIKKIISADVTREQEKNFRDEVTFLTD